MNVGWVTVVEHGAWLIQNVWVPHKMNVVPDIMRRNVRPADQSGHIAPETILGCSDPSSKYTALAWNEIQCPQSEQTWCPQETKFGGLGP